MKKFKWGVIGPGRIARQFAQGCSAVSDAEIFAVASRNPERGHRFADDFNAGRVYDSYEALVDDPDVDAVYIATPHRFHFDNTKLCLSAGKPVLCEKPLTVNAAESDELIRLSRERKVFLMEAVWSRYLPAYLQVRDWLNDGAIGEVRLIQSTFCLNLPRDANDRWFGHDLAGGALLDLGIYNINLSQWVYRENPESVVAVADIGDSGVDELISVSMRYGNARVSQFSAALVVQAANDMVIYGSHGHIHVHPYICVPTKVTLHTDNKETVVTSPLRANGYEFEIEEVMRCIRSGLQESPEMTLDETLDNMHVMDDIRKQIGLHYSFE